MASYIFPFFIIFIFTIPSYLIGSIPFGLILGKIFGAGDIRKIGSGNIGATNMLRTGKKGLAFTTLIFDMIKGYIASYLVGFLLGALYFGGSCLGCDGHNTGFDMGLCVGGFIAVVGHIWPIWLKFKGGKGVATTFGVLFAVSPIAGIITTILWLSIFYFTRYSSLSAIVAIGLSPIFAFFFGNSYFALTALLLALLVIYKHKDNIIRLKNGTESKFGSKKP